MGREWSLDRRIEKGLDKAIGAYTPGIDEQIIALRERLRREAAERDEAEEAERRRLEARFDRFLARWYGVLPAHQFVAYLLRFVLRMGYREASARTGKRREALRRNIWQGKHNLLPES
jgi:hypothetical protein